MEILSFLVPLSGKEDLQLLGNLIKYFPHQFLLDLSLSLRKSDTFSSLGKFGNLVENF